MKKIKKVSKKNLLVMVGIIGGYFLLMNLINLKLESAKRYQKITLIEIKMSPVFRMKDEGITYQINSNGNVFYQESTGLTITTEEYQLDSEQFDAIIALLKDKRALDFPEQWSEDINVMDGSDYYLSIKYNDQQCTSYAMNPIKQDLVNLISDIIKIIKKH